MWGENGVNVNPSLSWWEALAPTIYNFLLGDHYFVALWNNPPHRCLRWHTRSSARGVPCVGRWLGVSMMTWWLRWVFAYCFVAMARPDLQSCLFLSEWLMSAYFQKPWSHLWIMHLLCSPSPLSRLQSPFLQPCSIRSTYFLLWGHVYLIFSFFLTHAVSRQHLPEQDRLRSVPSRFALDCKRDAVPLQWLICLRQSNEDGSVRQAVRCSRGHVMSVWTPLCFGLFSSWAG